MLSVPALPAGASSIGARSVAVAAVVALALLAEGARPALLAHAPLALAPAVDTLEAAHLCNRSHKRNASEGEILLSSIRYKSFFLITQGSFQSISHFFPALLNMSSYISES